MSLITVKIFYSLNLIVLSPEVLESNPVSVFLVSEFWAFNLCSVGGLSVSSAAQCEPRSLLSGIAFCFVSFYVESRGS